MHHVILEEVPHTNNTTTHTQHTVLQLPQQQPGPAHHNTASLKNEFAYKYTHRATHTHERRHDNTTSQRDIGGNRIPPWFKMKINEMKTERIPKSWKTQFVSGGVEVCIGLGSVLLWRDNGIKT